MFKAAVAAAVLSATFIISGQAQSIPIFAGPFITFLPPAVDGTANTIVFGSSVTPQGKVQLANDLDVVQAGQLRTAVTTSITSVGVTADGTRAIYTDFGSNNEGLGIVDLSTGAVRRYSIDTQGCARPLAVCLGCFFACVATPHATPDGSKLLYAVRRNEPFYTMNADGSGMTNLPVYNGALAAAPQRVISDSGLIVFTSANPSGPTFAATATDVYVMNLDGSNIRNLTKFGMNASIFSNNAVISANGKTVAFESNYAGSATAVSSETQIWTVNTDGTGLRQLTSGPGSALGPSISGDGTAIVYTQSGQINRMLLTATATKTVLTAFHYSVPQAPAISADGTRVAFLLGPDTNSAGAVYEVNSDGTGVRAVYAPRAISPKGVVSAAGIALAPSPGGITSIYGINFANEMITGASAFPLTTVLAGVSASAGGVPLPMLSVSPWQINAQLPPQIPPATTDFRVSFADGSTTQVESTEIVTAAPGVFSSPVTIQGIVTLQAAVLHAGTADIADDAHPAHVGESLEIYGTGIGVTDPVVAAGQPSPLNPLARAPVTPAVRIGGIDLQVTFAGLTPGLAGVAQINVVVPPGLVPGRYVVSIKTDAGYQGAATIAVR